MNVGGQGRAAAPTTCSQASRTTIAYAQEENRRAEQHGPPSLKPLALVPIEIVDQPILFAVAFCTAQHPAITIQELERGILGVQRRDAGQGAGLRTWLTTMSALKLPAG